MRLRPYQGNPLSGWQRLASRIDHWHLGWTILYYRLREQGDPGTVVRTELPYGQPAIFQGHLTMYSRRCPPRSMGHGLFLPAKALHNKQLNRSRAPVRIREHHVHRKTLYKDFPWFT